MLADTELSSTRGPLRNRENRCLRYSKSSDLLFQHLGLKFCRQRVLQRSGTRIVDVVLSKLKNLAEPELMYKMRAVKTRRSVHRSIRQRYVDWNKQWFTNA